jgi:hypothetical protein
MKKNWAVYVFSLKEQRVLGPEPSRNLSFEFALPSMHRGASNLLISTKNESIVLIGGAAVRGRGVLSSIIQRKTGKPGYSHQLHTLYHSAEN